MDSKFIMDPLNGRQITRIFFMVNGQGPVVVKDQTVQRNTENCVCGQKPIDTLPRATKFDQRSSNGTIFS